MSNILRQRNRPQLITFAIANAALLGIIELGLHRFSSLVDQITKGDWATLGNVVATPAVAALILGLISWAIPAEWKEVLTFWRIGDRRLPSSMAFSRIAGSDPRIDALKLSQQIGKFPSEPAKQTALWYSIYRRHTLEPAVEDAHRAYLLYREMIGVIGTALVAVLLMGLIFQIPWRLTASSSFLLLFEYLIVMLSGRHAGEHLVANVLAIASTSTDAR